MLSPYNGFSFSNKNKELLIHATAWMNLEDMLRERNQTQRLYVV